MGGTPRELKGRCGFFFSPASGGREKHQPAGQAEAPAEAVQFHSSGREVLGSRC